MSEAGDVVGDRYRLERRLGRGGMGEVWLAVDTRLDRWVAVKFLPRSLADAAGVQRFHREARVTARLQHPGIVQVFDSGEQDGQLHLVMELLPGRDLGALLREHPRGLPVRQALDLAAQAADALSYAHLAGVVHRDIKPANLMLLPDGRVKVCDFGLVGFSHSGSGLTRAGAVLGTPAFMAPEQCRGEPLDGRADLYALGCVLFALLTGRPPFTVGGGFMAIAVAHITTPPPRVAELRSGLPVELDELVDRLLAKDPADRPGPAGDVAERLRALAQGRPHTTATGRTTAPTTSNGPTVTAGSGFSIEVFQNEYLPPGSTEVHAILTVRSAGVAPQDLAAPAPRSVVFLLGISTSLQADEYRAAVAAISDAVDDLDDGVRFALVAGSDYARMLYPDTMRLVRATPETRAEARAALARLEPAHASAYGRWLRLAERLLSGHPDTVRTAILLIDRPDDAEDDGELRDALAVCTGRFTCHVRGLGVDWNVGQARAVATATGGTVDIVHPVASPPGGGRLREELDSIIVRTRQRTARDLALRVTTPDGIGVAGLRQVGPSVENLTGAGQPIAPGAREYRVAVPDGESCDYHLELTVPGSGHAGEEYTAATLELVQLPPAGDGQTLARANVRTVLTDGLDSTAIHPQVAHYTGQSELAEAIRLGLEQSRPEEP